MKSKKEHVFVSVELLEEVVFNLDEASESKLSVHERATAASCASGIRSQLENKRGNSKIRIPLEVLKKVGFILLNLLSNDHVLAKAQKIIEKIYK